MNGFPSLRGLAAIALALCIAAPVAHAATALAQLRYVPDITVDLNGTTVGPNAVANDTLAGSPTLALSGLPVDVAAYAYTGTVHWLVFDTTVNLGAFTATPRDVVSYDGSTYTLILNGATAGIPDGVAIDALSSTNGVDFLLSFDTTATVGSVFAAPEDVVQYAGGTWSSYFDGSTAGVPAGANLDALYRLSNGHLLMSFDIAGTTTVGAVGFTAGDVLEYTAPNTWELAFSPASLYPGWGAANLHGLWAQAAPIVPGTLQFSSPTYSVNETDPTATITVTRSGGASGMVTVHYATSNGTATAGPDYAATSGTLTWANGVSAPQTFTIPISDDGLPEGNETVHLTLSAPTGGATLGAQATAALTIIDNDLAPHTPMAGVSTANLDFGDQVLATTSGTQTVTVTSNGNAPLNFTPASVVGANAADFSIVSNTCIGSLAPLASCAIGLRFTPSALGPRGANLNIASDAASPAVALTGNGVAVPIAGNLTGVPTLSEWALMLLSLMMGGVGLASRRRAFRQFN
jgi:hypothetical protein